MLRTLSLAAGVALWGASIYAATQLHRFELDLSHGICGPWGCAAAPEALLGYHLLLTAVVAPGLAVVALWLDAAKAVRLGRLAMGLGLLGLIGLFAAGAATWLADGRGTEYALQRGLFQIATTPDLPALPLLLGGLAARVVGWARGGCGCGANRSGEGVLLEATAPGSETLGTVTPPEPPQ